MEMWLDKDKLRELYYGVAAIVLTTQIRELENMRITFNQCADDAKMILHNSQCRHLIPDGMTDEEVLLARHKQLNEAIRKERLKVMYPDDELPIELQYRKDGERVLGTRIAYSIEKDKVMHTEPIVSSTSGEVPKC